MKKKRKRLLYGAAVVFWLVVWQLAAMAIGQEVFLVSPIQALGTLLELLPQAEFWQRIGFSAGRILLGFGLGAVSSVVLAVAAGRWAWVEALLSPVMQLVKATPVASFIILALVWVSGSSLSVLISFLMVLPVLYGAVRTGIGSADVQLLEMAKVFRLPLGRRLRAIWLPAVLPAFRQGCSVALGICWKSGVAAEVIGLPDGSIGDALYRAKITLSTGELFVKRLFDIIGGLVGCVLTGILFLFLAPAIKIQSPGPVFFSQIRVGKNGKKFKLYKFRSMYTDAEERKAQLAAENRVTDGLMFKLDFDPRIIGCRQLPDGTVKKGIGNFIRDWSFDEFPQFWNVLKGDMSLVGTRPPTEDEWVRYELHHRSRLAIKPGITGMWQVSGRSNITDFEKVVELDRYYILNWSLGLDVKIIFRTVPEVVKKNGSM